MTTGHPLDTPVAAVPDRITEVSDWPAHRRITEAETRADTIAASPDLHAPDLAEAVTTGLAILARRPGGVTVPGVHWCQHPHLDCPGTGGTLDLPLPTDDRTRGAVYTPRELAEQLVHTGLAPWTEAASSPQLLSLRVCDPAAGAGALLLAACRCLAEQLVAAWRRETGHQDAGALTAAAARRLVQRCLYGGDLDPTAAVLARLAVALLAPTAPDMLATRIVVGDMLVGYGNVEQLRDMDPGCFPARATPVHWPLAFPEVYVGAGRAPGFDAVLSNVPYLGGQKITGVLGKPYRDYLVQVVAGGVRGSADLAAYCTLRAHDLVHRHGTVSVIATDTLWQGATRRVGLDELVDHGWSIWSADKSLPWPESSAAVTCCMVHTVGGPQVARPQPWPHRSKTEPALADGADWERALLHAAARSAAA